jgi:trans-aconitate methyltransferase
LAGDGGIGLNVAPSRLTVKWNAADYAANSAVQQSWARELIAKLKLRGDEHVLDVGCGDGKITAELARALPRGSVIGLDASAEMIGFAEKTFPSARIPNLGFRVTDARQIDFNQKFDVVFSNAAWHWVDDHEAILRGVSAAMKSGGRLVVSCGGKGNAHDVFLALRPEMRRKRWCAFFRKMPLPYFFYSPEDYQKWLPRYGFKINVVELVPKVALYDGAEGLATWIRTTWIPFVQRVPESLRAEFVAAVTNRYLVKHPPDPQGKIHIRMVRLEIDAVKI